MKLRSQDELNLHSILIETQRAVESFKLGQTDYADSIKGYDLIKETKNSSNYAGLAYLKDNHVVISSGPTVDFKDIFPMDLMIAVGLYTSSIY
jgi:hypothetical protein